MVRAELLEAQSGRVSSPPADITPRRKPNRRPNVPWSAGLTTYSLRKGNSAFGATSSELDNRRTSHLTHARYVTTPVSAGSPKGREPHGDGVPIVVRGRESRPHGEGEQVATMPVQGSTRYA